MRRSIATVSLSGMLREKMKPVIAQFSADVGESTVHDVQAELAKLRK